MDQTGTVTVAIPAAVADRLQQGADALGLPLDAYIGRLAEREAARQREHAAWAARFEAWAASSPPRGVKLDDSRESIYEGR